ncbi:MAG TPA: sugar phosphate nucleotidyltransferase [Polyangiaceae bacterium]|nr:sugar phosphate nucleotidyltransferase [Polyangiaceae bacterium]
MQCVILAGGLGTRMRPRTETVPKSLLEVAGRPFVDHQLAWLAAHGVSSVVLSIGHLGERIEAHVGDGARYGIPVRTVSEGDTLRGTAGALRLALERGALEADFLLVYGDSYLPVDFGAVARAFRASTLPALMTVFENEGRWDTSNVVFDEAKGRIVVYDKQQKLRPRKDFRYIDYGLSAFRRSVIERDVPAGVRYDLADVMRELSVRGELLGLRMTERFYEIGSPQGLQDLERLLGPA